MNALMVAAEFAGLILIAAADWHIALGVFLIVTGMQVRHNEFWHLKRK